MLLVAALVFFLAVAYSCQWFCKGGFLLKVTFLLEIAMSVGGIACVTSNSAANQND